MSDLANRVIDSLIAHRSIRRFSSEPVDEQDLRRAVRAGQQASTSSNIQAYCLIRIRDARRRKRLVELTGGQKKVADCGAFLVVCGDTRRHRLIARRAGKPHASNLESFMLAVIDASLFAQNMVVALESLGYGTCYVGGLRNDLPAVHEVLGTPEGVWPIFGLCIGRPAKIPECRPRLDTDAVLFEETYPSDEAMIDSIDEYDGRMAAWYRRQGIETPGWTARLEGHFEERRRTRNARWYRQAGADFQ